MKNIGIGRITEIDFSWGILLLLMTVGAAAFASFGVAVGIGTLFNISFNFNEMVFATIIGGLMITMIVYFWAAVMAGDKN